MFSQENITQLVSAFRAGDANGFVQSLSQALTSQIALLQAQVTALAVSSSIGNGVTGTVRSLDTDFIVHATRDAQVSYTIESVTSATGVGATDDDANVQLVINGQVVHSIRNRLQATATAILGILGFSLTGSTQRWPLVGFVPAGSTVNITTSGGGTKSLISVQEVLL